LICRTPLTPICLPKPRTTKSIRSIFSAPSPTPAPAHPSPATPSNCLRAR